MIGIIAAMQLELEAIKQKIENPVTETVSGIAYISGSIYGYPVVCAVSGVGKVNAAVCAQTMILKYAPEAIINTGVGGALDKELKVCDVVVGDCAVQHDFDTSPLGDEKGFVSTVNVTRFPLDEKLSGKLLASLTFLGIRAKSGTIATGDQFVCDPKVKEEIVSRFSAKACEMEGGAIAHACYMNSTPCAILRAISDGADDGATLSYTEFAQIAANQSVRALLHFIKTSLA